MLKIDTKNYTDEEIAILCKAFKYAKDFLMPCDEKCTKCKNMRLCEVLFMTVQQLTVEYSNRKKKKIDHK